MYSIKIDHSNKLIRYQHQGQITRDDISKAWDELLKLEEFATFKYNLVSDYRKGILTATNDDFEKILDSLVTVDYILKSKKQAIITDTPMNTALSMLFERKANKRLRFIVKVFSTEEVALNWIMN